MVVLKRCVKVFVMPRPLCQGMFPSASPVNLYNWQGSRWILQPFPSVMLNFSNLLYKGESRTRIDHSIAQLELSKENPFMVFLRGFYALWLNSSMKLHSRYTGHLEIFFTSRGRSYQKYWCSSYRARTLTWRCYISNLFTNFSLSAGHR